MNKTSSGKNNYKTPLDFYQKLDEEFHFDFDPCPYTPDDKPLFDGLECEWGKRNFINPPYSPRSLKERFIKKSIEESKKGKLCVLLLPVSTSTKIFHESILPNKKEIRFIRNRLKFFMKSPAYFDSMVVIFDEREKNDTMVL